MNIRPEDFSSDTPPVRTIGVECEYNLQQPDEDPLPIRSFIDAVSLRSIGVTNHNGYLGHKYGSGRAYADVGHLEFDTAEAMGPASAAVEDIAGIGHISDIVNRTDYPHLGLYRMAGSYIPNGRVNDEMLRTSSGLTSGCHENYLFPRRFADDELIDNLLPTMLASRLWAMSGTLREDGFVFSQKAWGTGGYPIARTMGRRTTHGNKPMVTIPSIGDDDDTIGSEDWARLEVRMADPGLSIVNRYLGFAAVSLTLRLIEQQHITGRQTLLGMSLADPVDAARQYAGDLTLSKAAVRNDGRTMGALDAQENLLELFNSLDNEVQLPPDEKLAIVAIQGLVDALRVSEPAKATYSKLARARIDFVAKHQFISQGKPQSAICAASVAAMQRNLLWDRVLPIGNGIAFWTGMAERDPMAEHVRTLAKQAGGLAPRATLRAKIVDSDEQSSSVLSWTKYRDGMGNVRNLGSPYGQ